MSEILNSIQEEAENCVSRFSKRYDDGLDYSINSLELIDEILDDASDYAEEMAEGQLIWLQTAVGAYILEVARRKYGGQYYWYKKLEQVILVTGQPNFEISILTAEKVMARLKNGTEDNIPFFFQGYAERVESAKPGDKAIYI